MRLSDPSIRNSILKVITIMPTPRHRSPKGLPWDAANEKISELRRLTIPSVAARENWDLPLDPDIRVTSEFPSHKIELIVEGEALSWLTVVDFQQQIAGAQTSNPSPSLSERGGGEAAPGPLTLRMGGIAGVGTHNDHRFKGYSRRVIENSLRWMRREGFDSSMLYGIPSYYPKYGYAPAFPDAHFMMSVRDAELVRANLFAFVDFNPDKHLGAVLEMYNSNNAGRTGPTMRDPRYWTPFRKGLGWTTKAMCRVVLDGNGKPAGYVVYDRHDMSAIVIEVGWTTPAVFRDILRHAARHAWEQRLETIHFHLPEDDAFIEFCKPLGLKSEITARKDGGAMVRLMSVETTLRKLVPNLEERLKQAGVDADFMLPIQTNLDSVVLRRVKGKIRVEPLSAPPKLAVRLPQWALAQMVYGYRQAWGLKAWGDLKATNEQVELLERLFPMKPHFHYSVDHF